MLVRGVELEVRDEGEGRLLLWGHGVLSSMEAEDDMGVLAPRAAEGVRVVRYDARGHGRSQATTDDGDYKWASLAEDMLGVLDAVGAESAVLGGASMGTATAVHAASMAPDRVEALVLAIPPTAWGGRRVQAAMYRAGATTVQVTGLRAFAALGRAAPAPKILTGDLAHVRDAMLGSFDELDRRTVPHILRGAAASDLPAKDALTALTMPTLILAWEGDPGHPLDTATQLARLLPDARLLVASEPEDVLRWPTVVTDFVRGLR